MLTNYQKSRFARLRRAHVPASTALEKARAFDGTDHGSKQIWSHRSYVWNSPDKDNVRWIENTNRAGLRLVGHADEICRSINHTGWFADDFQDEKLRGAVWQLPARDGKAQYVAGYEYPNNDGAARICFDVIEGETGDWSGWQSDDARIEAAQAADSMAERDAEKEREYQADWHNAQTARGMMKQARETGQEAIDLIREATELCAARGLGSIGFSPDDQSETVNWLMSTAQNLIADYREKRQAAISFIDEHSIYADKSAWAEGYA